MVTRTEALGLIEKYLAYENKQPDKYVFKNPVYTNWLKKIAAFALVKYWKWKKEDRDKIIEDYIEPDKWVSSPVHEIVVEEGLKDLGVCWSVYYCSKQFYETNNVKYGSIGGGPIFVDKESGVMYQTGSSPIDWLEDYKKHKRGVDVEEWPIWEPMDKRQFIY